MIFYKKFLKNCFYMTNTFKLVPIKFHVYLSLFYYLFFSVHKVFRVVAVPCFPTIINIHLVVVYLLFIQVDDGQRSSSSWSPSSRIVCFLSLKSLFVNTVTPRSKIHKNFQLLNLINALIKIAKQLMI